MIAIGVTATPVVRPTRGQAAKVDYVEVPAPWQPALRIALRHVLPNIVPPLLVQASLAIAGAIIAEAALFLGQQPPAPSWGSMSTAQRFIAQAP
jgi:peptide/nickel transport system permease protein